MQPSMDGTVNVARIGDHAVPSPSAAAPTNASQVAPDTAVNQAVAGCRLACRPRRHHQLCRLRRRLCRHQLQHLILITAAVTRLSQHRILKPPRCATGTLAALAGFGGVMAAGDRPIAKMLNVFVRQDFALSEEHVSRRIHARRRQMARAECSAANRVAATRSASKESAFAQLALVLLTAYALRSVSKRLANPATYLTARLVLAASLARAYVERAIAISMETVRMEDRIKIPLC